jgi:hypothetical protein
MVRARMLAENSMKAKVGFWIDHRKAIIVAVSSKGEERTRDICD